MEQYAKHFFNFGDDKIDRHSCVSFRRSVPPKTLASNGSPPHFFAISFPIDSKSAANVAPPSPLTFCLIMHQHSSSDSPLGLC
uniref:Uncharacterized protein n=1 Tax=Salix viminalis TaxID=40686 RepID=A0A6N2KSA6_SALVM